MRQKSQNRERRGQKNSFRYIAFEGIDGCGKTTQLSMFADYLRSKGFDVFLTKEPGGARSEIRDLLLNGRWSYKAELFLFLADRVEHSLLVRKKMEGYVVLSDRCMYSTLAYQGYGLGMDLEFLENLNVFATGGLKPDLVFCFDIDLETMKNRLKSLDVIESRGDDFFERVRQGYLDLSKRMDNFFVVDGRKDKTSVSKDVVKIWESL